MAINVAKHKNMQLVVFKLDECMIHFAWQEYIKCTWFRLYVQIATVGCQ